MSSKLLFIKIPRERYSGMKDEQLISRFRKKGDQNIIDELFNRYAHLLFPVCMKYLRDEDSSRDMVLEIFSELGEKLMRFDVQHLKSWLHTVARNACLMKIRKNSHELVTDQIEIFQNFAVENHEDNHHHEEQEQVSLKLIGMMTRLRDGQKVCLEMMYFQQMSYKEISDATGYSMKQVKSFIQNGKRNLRLLFEGKK